MGKSSLIAARPRGALLLGLRLPIWLYRLHIGWILGNRFLLLNHTGRKGGQTYQTVVEVVKHDRASDTFFVVSGWGRRADWYQNIHKTRDVVICSGGRELPVHAEDVLLSRAVDILNEYSHQHPIAFRELAGIFLGERLQPGRDASQRLAEGMPMVAFRPRRH